uniref:Nuclear receptor domain-containing protein n=1 Tax=Ascaris lumbricoides TaxID=6252 RepID=A0A0M3ICN1_ASCLU
MSFQSSSDYSQEEMLCSNVLSPESFSDDADEGTIEEAENTSRVDAVGSDPKDATLSQKRKAINRVCPQVCTVCSGPANGYHYDVPSCNGCKAFFRRSFVSGRRYECKKNRKCKLNEVDRQMVSCQDLPSADRARSNSSVEQKRPGYHYDVPSCNGCKAFFRRSFVSGRRYECKKNRKCKLNEGRRTSCRACRYNKCVEVGMKPQLVQLSNDVISSRSSHVQTSKDTQFHETPLAMHSITAKLLWFDESEFAAIIGTLVYNESQCNFLRRSTFDPAGTRLSLADLISAPSELHNLHAYQLLLSKNVALANCSLMQSYYSYKSKSNAIVFPDGIFPILFTKRPPPVEVILSYGGVEPLIRSMIDECEYVLLKAIIFTHYCHYAGARYGATIGSCRFAELLALVGTFFHLADKHRQFHTLLSIIVHPQKHHSILLEEMLA